MGYIDADALYKVVTEKYRDINAGMYPYNIVAYDMAKLVEKAPTADVVERSECKKWYHEYHVIKEDLKQEKEYHRSTEKLADKYQAELECLRSLNRRLEKAMGEKEEKIQELIKQIDNVEVETALEVAREILTEVESELAEVKCIDREFGVYLDLTIAELKKKYVGGEGDE